MLKVLELSEGNVKAILYNNGQSTAGVMAPGEYEFQMKDMKESMLVVRGEMDVMVDGAWKKFKEGEKFISQPNSKMNVKIYKDMVYLCDYV